MRRTEGAELDTAFVTGPGGLTSEQVEQRRRAGLVNHLPPTSGRTVTDIIAQAISSVHLPDRR